MLELGGRLLELLAAGERVAIATAIDVIGSAPNPVGTSMAVSADGTVLGSVSAGCVEDGALAACRRMLGGGAARVLRFGFGEAASGGGLSCGGELDVLVHPAGGEALRRELQAAAEGRAAAVGLVVAGPPRALGALIGAGGGAGLEDGLGAWDPEALRRLRVAVVAQAGTGRRGVVTVACGGTVVRAFVDTAVPAARLVLCGATETAVALAAAAAATGWAVTVSDPRPALTSARRFPAGTEVVVGAAHEHLATLRLDERSAVCLLGHDEDLDPLAAAVALERGAGYVGALGSRATAARRRERLRLLGVPEHLVERLHGPIGLDLGAVTPAETAVSILAELLACRRGATARPLTAGHGPIHRASRSASAVQQAPEAVAGHRQPHRP